LFSCQMVDSHDAIYNTRPAIAKARRLVGRRIPCPSLPVHGQGSLVALKFLNHASGETASASFLSLRAGRILPSPFQPIQDGRIVFASIDQGSHA
jgi:hypothetical protein